MIIPSLTSPCSHFHLPVDLCTVTILHSPWSHSHDPFLNNCDVSKCYDVQFDNYARVSFDFTFCIVQSLTNLKNRSAILKSKADQLLGLLIHNNPEWFYFLLF